MADKVKELDYGEGKGNIDSEASPSEKPGKTMMEEGYSSARPMHDNNTASSVADLPKFELNYLGSADNVGSKSELPGSKQIVMVGTDLDFMYYDGKLSGTEHTNLNKALIRMNGLLGDSDKLSTAVDDWKKQIDWIVKNGENGLTQEDAAKLSLDRTPLEKPAGPAPEKVGTEGFLGAIKAARRNLSGVQDEQTRGELTKALSEMESSVGKENAETLAKNWNDKLFQMGNPSQIGEAGKINFDNYAKLVIGTDSEFAAPRFADASHHPANLALWDAVVGAVQKTGSPVDNVMTNQAAEIARRLEKAVDGGVELNNGLIENTRAEVISNAKLNAAANGLWSNSRLDQMVSHVLWLLLQSKRKKKQLPEYCLPESCCTRSELTVALRLRVIRAALQCNLWRQAVPCTV